MSRLTARERFMLYHHRTRLLYRVSWRSSNYNPAPVHFLSAWVCCTSSNILAFWINAHAMLIDDPENDLWETHEDIVAEVRNSMQRNSRGSRHPPPRDIAKDVA